MTIFIIDYAENSFLDESIYRFDSVMPEKSENAHHSFLESKVTYSNRFSVQPIIQNLKIQYPLRDTKKSFCFKNDC